MIFFSFSRKSNLKPSSKKSTEQTQRVSFTKQQPSRVSPTPEDTNPIDVVNYYISVEHRNALAR